MENHEAAVRKFPEVFSGLGETQSASLSPSLAEAVPNGSKINPKARLAAVSASCLPRSGLRNYLGKSVPLGTLGAKELPVIRIPTNENSAIAKKTRIPCQPVLASR